jgi:hypothetical protein
MSDDALPVLTTSNNCAEDKVRAALDASAYATENQSIHFLWICLHQPNDLDITVTRKPGNPGWSSGKPAVILLATLAKKMAQTKKPEAPSTKMA